MEMKFSRRGFLIGAGALLTPLGAFAQTPNAVSGDPWVFGSGFELLPAGKSGEVEVIAYGPLIDTELPIIVRNGSTKTVGVSEVTVSARDTSGKLIGVAESSSIAPRNIEAGALQVGHCYFSDAVPTDATFEFVIGVGEPSDSAPNLLVVEVEAASDAYLGTVMNPHSFSTTGPISIDGVGLDDSGNVVGYISGFAATDDLDPEASTLFNVDYYGETASHVLIAASGYNF